MSNRAKTNVAERARRPKRIRVLSNVVLGVVSGAAFMGMAIVALAQPHVPTLQQRFHPVTSGHPGTPPAATPTTPTPATTTTTIASAGQASDAKTRLAQYVDKTNATIHAAVHVGGKGVTQDERNAVKDHWRVSMRLLRIRDLADQAKDTTSVSLVDSDLAALDAHFETQLKALNAKAPK